MKLARFCHAAPNNGMHPTRFSVPLMQGVAGM
jgi:hypothetical protein